MIDKKTGMAVDLVGTGTSILAVTAHLHMIVIRDREAPGYTSDKNQHNGNSVSVDNGASIIDTIILVL